MARAARLDRALETWPWTKGFAGAAMLEKDELERTLGNPAGAAASRSLLLVDDDLPFLNLLARCMEKRGFCVRTARSVTDAAARAAEDPPAYVVLDLQLGDGSGLDLVPILRSLSSDTRIIMLTGYGNLEATAFATKAAMVDCLAKPADADEIETALLGRGKCAATSAVSLKNNRVQKRNVR